MTKARNQQAGALADSQGRRDSLSTSLQRPRGPSHRATMAGTAGAMAMAAALLLPGVGNAADAPKGDPQRAADKVAMCVGCHGIKGYRASYPEVYSVPMIAGQSERYLAAALEAYRKGDRAHPTMRAIAGSLTDEDIADLAAYYAHGGRHALSASR